MNPSDHHRASRTSTRGRRVLVTSALAGAVLAVCVLGGCSGTPERPKVAPVHGHVSYQGQPVAGATVTFSCKGAPRFASGTTDTEGNYTLTTFDPNDGAVVGRNVVTVSKSTMPTGPTADSPLSEDYLRALEASEKVAAAGGFLPARYADPNTSGIAVEVTDGPNQHDLRLED